MGNLKQKFVILVCSLMVFSMTVNAQSLDDLSNGTTSSSSGTTQESTTSSTTDSGDGVANWMADYTPVTDENMEQASSYTAPLTNVIGWLTGAILIVASAAIFLITAIDLLYIAVPFIRGYLDGSRAGGGGQQGGMNMGMNNRMGGMQQGGMQQGGGGGHCFVSTEAKNAVMGAGGGGQQGGGGMNMGGMQGGYGGGMNMGGMQQGGGQVPAGGKSEILTYLKSRMFFLVIFSVAVVILSSSILVGTGINIAQALTKVIDMFNTSLANAI